MFKDKDLLYFSNYPKQSKYYDNLNNLVVGKMEDETCGVLLKGLVRLKTEICTVTTEHIHECKNMQKVLMTMLLPMN